MVLLRSIKKSANPHTSFFTKIYCIAIGMIVLSSFGIASLQVMSYIVAQYSQ